MVKSKPPESLDRLRTLLDTAAVRRWLLPHEGPVSSAEARAAALDMRLDAVAHPQFALVDEDVLVAIIPGDRRLDSAALAATVGGRRARLAGAEQVRRRFGYEPGTVPLVTGLPTVLDRALLSHDFLFGATGDPLWTLRIASQDLKRATSALVAMIARTG